MNIFYLHNDPVICAEMHNDKHCIKMILETAQLLSTAHRVLDGTLKKMQSETGRWKTYYDLPYNGKVELYSATHINHPSAIWCRQSLQNYMWLHSLLVELCKEYTYRYGKIHKCEKIKLVEMLGIPPKNIDVVRPFTEPTPAMPDNVKVKGNSLASYRNYYISNKQHLATWSGKINSRPVPEWFNA
jgi:hypothetical protein